MEYNTNKYQFNQDGRDYVVSTGLVGNRIRITCQQNLALDGPFYSNEFTLDDLRHANQFFMLPQTPEEALSEINKGIERQKSGLSPGSNDTMIFVGYLVIGTDNDMYNLPLRRDYEPNKYGIFTPPSSGAADLVLQSNYQVDGGRLNASEANCGDLQRNQTVLEEELNGIIPEINKLRKLSLDIKEENALVRERLKILQEQLEERKRSVFKLKEENENLKRENQELTNYIKNQENLIREKQALQTTIQVKSRPNISHGRSAVTSKFEQSALRTFFPRTMVKPVTEDYIKKNTYIGPQTTTNISPIIQTEPQQQFIVPTSGETNYLPTVYVQEKMISHEPIVVQTEAPDVTYSTKPNIGDDMNFSARQYTTSNTLYNYNMAANPINKTVTYSGKIPEIGDKSYSSHFVTGKDTGYTSSKMTGLEPRINDAAYTSSGNRDIPYSSSGTRDIPYTSKTNKDIPYTSSRNRDVPYTSFKNKDSPYTSSRSKDNTYGSSGNRDLPYTSKKNKLQDNSYTSSGNKNVPYSSLMSKGNNKKDGGYTSSKINQNDGPYESHISNNSNLGGYSSQMANTLGDSANAGYSSQMAQANEKFIQGTTNKRPKGSRAPNANQGNYGRPKGSRAPNEGRDNDDKDFDVGYSSYK